MSLPTRRPFLRVSSRGQDYEKPQGAKIRAQELGQEAVEPNIPDGAVAYAGYAKKPLIHQLSNIDTKTFWVVGFEIMYPESWAFFSIASLGETCLQVRTR